MKTITITVTNEDSEVLDRKTIEIPDDHQTVYFRTGTSVIAPRGDEDELQIGL